jgi:uncharacterized protein
MEQRVSLVTLGVADLERARGFYEALGWRGQTVERTTFFQAGPVAVVLWSRERLAEDCGIVDDGGRFGGIVLAHNVRSEAEVDAVLAAAARAGGRVTQPARRTFYGGYAGVVADPDDHLWEIAHNPGFGLAPDGALVLPAFG